MSHRDLQPSDSAGIEYRLEGGLFYLRRLQAKTEASSAANFGLQYVDVAAFSSLTTDRQCSLDVISETYLPDGLMVNTTNADGLSASSHDAPTFSTSHMRAVITLTPLNNFHYIKSVGIIPLRQTARPW